MNLISVFVFVGAIGFIKCGLHREVTKPFRSIADDWHAKHRGNVTEESDQNSYLNKTAVDEITEQEKSLFQGFHQLKNIYVECESRVGKRLQKIIKAEVKSLLPDLKSYLVSLYQCVKVFSFRSLDEILEDDFIPVTDHVYFLKDGKLTDVAESLSTGRTATILRSSPFKDYAARVMSQGWTALVYERLANLFRTHSLKFRFPNSLVSQGRARRRDHRMFAIMVMGFMIMASILIPMGFQFLTVLGGKSLLLAKMALIMSAISGLKKIATRNVGYGYYHTGSDGHHHDHLHHGYHEKHFHLDPQNYNFQGYN